MNKWIRVYLSNPLKEYNKVKHFFNPLKMKVQFGKTYNLGGFPLYLNNLPYILYIGCFGVSWKDKYNTPRHEFNPCVNIILFRKWKIYISWNYFENGEDRSMEYWEAALMWLYYKKGLVYSVKSSIGWKMWDESKQQYIPIKYSLLKEPYQSLLETGNLENIRYEEFCNKR